MIENRTTVCIIAKQNRQIVNCQIKLIESINIIARIRQIYLKHGFQNIKRETVGKKSIVIIG